jgi:pantothenate synthetase
MVLLKGNRVLVTFGVAAIVTKLFNIGTADISLWAKDAAQCVLIPIG